MGRIKFYRSSEKAEFWKNSSILQKTALEDKVSYLYFKTSFLNKCLRLSRKILCHFRKTKRDVADYLTESESKSILDDYVIKYKIPVLYLYLPIDPI